MGSDGSIEDAARLEVTWGVSFKLKPRVHPARLFPAGTVSPRHSGDSCATRSRGRSRRGPSDNNRERAKREAEKAISEGSPAGHRAVDKREDRRINERIAAEGFEDGE